MPAFAHFISPRYLALLTIPKLMTGFRRALNIDATLQSSSSRILRRLFGPRFWPTTGLQCFPLRLESVECWAAYDYFYYERQA